MDRIELPALGEDLGHVFFRVLDGSVRDAFALVAELPHTVRESLFLRLAPSLRDSFQNGLVEALR